MTFIMLMHSFIIFKSSSGKFLTINRCMQQCVLSDFVFLHMGQTPFITPHCRSAICANTNAITPLNAISFEEVIYGSKNFLIGSPLWKLFAKNK